VPEQAAASAERTFAFGPFRLFPSRQLLLEGDRPVRLGSRALDILVTVVERAGELVTKDELTARVWPGIHVEEGNLRVRVAAVRRALGDGQTGNRYLANVPGRGYRFVTPVEVTEGQATAASRPATVERVHNSPAPLTRMVGRSNTVETLVARLPQRRLATMTRSCRSARRPCCPRRSSGVQSSRSIRAPRTAWPRHTRTSSTPSCWHSSSVEQILWRHGLHLPRCRGGGDPRLAQRTWDCLLSAVGRISRASTHWSDRDETRCLCRRGGCRRTHPAQDREHAGRTSPRDRHRRRGRADPEPAGEAPGQPYRRLPPGASSAPHRHAPSAFIYAYVLSGEIRSQVDDEPARVYRAGETWFEGPGAHHRVSANASDTEPARLLAVLVVDVADEPLVIPDPQ
jgi:DNA-binding winged helix-turn-helix (wHTH) protein/mannose-6-phosphate isomerase-like protein (cupin superfamily)